MAKKNASKAAVIVIDFTDESVTAQFFTGPGCAQKAEDQAVQLRSIDGGMDNGRVLVQANDEAIDSFRSAREAIEAKATKPAAKSAAKKSKAVADETDDE